MNTYIFTIVTFIYLAGMVVYIGYLAFRNPWVRRAATAITLGGWLVQTFALGLRWYESYQLGIGHAPMSNLYESLVFFSWTIILIYLVIEYKYHLYLLGAFVTPFAAMGMAYASISPNVNETIQPLVPALQSNWLISHVVTCFLGYAAFAVSCGVSITYIMKKRHEEGAGKTGLLASFPSSLILDDLVYKTIAIGFPLLTIGIVTGAAWANYAWGTYWSWDPKETWSLITWFIYAAFLHARFTRGWRGVKAAMLSIVGFVAVLFTYLGVNLLLSGLHSYGAG
ncbi:MAG: c-type cytochrome biogenesis protein CcsB [Deltaproteobacteria bacterium]|nr:c-type cytochrome biogenesis protein CcsB [Candidatus Anaeroferrophillus wilburensis]MBN2888108.1 c-type cytochrome biogenesis protein CcsB [Deltaproteobacteria bacterium]